MMLCESFWTAPWQVFDYHLAAEAIRRCVDQGVLTRDDLWLTDDAVWEKMSGGDAGVHAIMNQMQTLDAKRINAAEGEGQIEYERKVRLQDPLFKKDGNIMRVTSAAKDLQKQFQSLEEVFNTPLRFPAQLVNGPKS
jgi:hypothetical protein